MTIPSPDVVCSSTMTWPDFSPPSIAPGDLHPLEDVLVADRASGRPRRRPPRPPPGARRSRGPTRRGRPAARRARAARGRGSRGPGRHRRSAPSPSTAIRRSASPSSAKPTSAPRAATARASDAGAVAPHSTLMLTPSGSTWIASTRAPVAARISRPPRHPSRSRHRARCAARSRRSSRRARADARDSARSPRAASTRRPSCAFPTPPSSPSRQISASSSSSIASSSLSPSASSTLRPLSSAGLCEAETMIPARTVAGPGEERERRRRDDADDVDVDAEAGRAGDDGRHEHVARAARVLADDDRRAGLGQSPRRRPTEGVRHGRLQVDVGDAADAVRAEEASHRVSRPGRRASSERVTVDRDLWRAGRHERDAGRQVGRDRAHRSCRVRAPRRRGRPPASSRSIRSRSASLPPTVIRTRSIADLVRRSPSVPRRAEPRPRRSASPSRRGRDRRPSPWSYQRRRRRSAGARPTSTVCEAEKPPTGIGSRVDAWPAPAARRRRPGPSRSAARRRRDAISNPAAGEPVICGLTGSVF